MKKLILIVISIMVFLFTACDYEGTEPANSSPSIALYDQGNNISSSKTRISWYGNDLDGLELSYKWVVTTDTTITKENCINEIPQDLWAETNVMYADVSMPYVGDFFSLDSINVGTIAEPEWEIQKTVWSKFFVYAQDENNNVSFIDGKVFGRTNNPPDIPIFQSDKLGVTTSSKVKITDEKFMILKSQTSTWSPIKIKWIATDPDGGDVEIEYRYELLYKEENGEYTLVESSGDWSDNITNVTLSEQIYNEGKDGWWRLNIYARDDALVESEENAWVEFYAFAPKFEKGVLIIDRTDNGENGNYGEGSGNPDPEDVTAFYDEMMNYCGYYLDYEETDPVYDYDVWNYSDQDKYPDLEVIGNYRMVFMHNDDTFRDGTGIASLSNKKVFMEYMNVGGSFVLTGHSVHFHLFKQSDYTPPIRFKDASLTGSPFINAKDLINDYMGIYSVTTPSSYTNNSSKLDYQNADFLGVDLLPHNSALKPMRVDREKAKFVWNYTHNNNPQHQNSVYLKNDGRVMPGVQTYQGLLGALQFKYRSIYDLEPYPFNPDSMTYEVVGNDTIKYDLYCPNVDPDTGEKNPVFERTGAAGNYYKNGTFECLVLGLPLYFMDNSNNEVFDNMKYFIDDFGLENNPITK